MKLSSRTEYAFLALLYLARNKQDKMVHGSTIAKEQKIPIRFLQQILFILKQARLVKSIKGKNGGYSLSRDPTKITVAEVVRLFDGPLAPSRTVSKYFYERTPIAGEVKMTALLQEVRDIISDKLEDVFLSDLV